MTRKIALATIRADILQNGSITKQGMRAYAESHISNKVLNEYIKKYSK